jgi:hypothetical protein
MKSTFGGRFIFSRHVSETHRGTSPPLIRSPKRTSRSSFSSGQRKLKWREQGNGLIELPRSCTSLSEPPLNCKNRHLAQVVFRCRVTPTSVRQVSDLRLSMSSIKRDVKKKLFPRPDVEKIFVSRSSPLPVSVPLDSLESSLWLVSISVAFIFW